MMVRAWIVLTALAFMAAGCQATTGRQAGEFWDDQQIRARANTALAGIGPGVATRVSVESREGVVFLTGAVQDEDTRQRAVQTVRALPGVRQVVSNLYVAGQDPAASPAGERVPGMQQPPAPQPPPGAPARQ